MKRIAALLVLLASAACGSDPSGPDANLLVDERCASPAPLQGSAHPALPNQYIVVFENGVDARIKANALATRYGFQTRFVYESALSGFAATMEPRAVAAVRCDRAVRYVEHDQLVTIGD